MEPRDKTDTEAIRAGQRLTGIFSDASEEHYSSRPTRRITPENRAESKKDVVLKRFGAGVLLVFALAGGVAAETYATRQPEFSTTNKIYAVEQGDSVWSAASEVEGIDQVDKRDVVEHIQEMPENADTLKNGLHPGEVLITPESVRR